MQSKLTCVLAGKDFNYKQPEFFDDEDELEVITGSEDVKKDVIDVKKENPALTAVELTKREKEEPPVAPPAAPAPPEKRGRSGGASAKKKHKT